MVHAKPLARPHLPAKFCWGCLLVYALAYVMAGALAGILGHPAQADEQWPDLPEDDLEARLDQVSDGTLSFLTEAPEGPVHHHENRIHIIPESLQTGWVELTQCHHHLDQVPLLEITYHPERIRNIHVLSAYNIDQYMVLDAGVELRGIHAGASICLRAESRALRPVAPSSYGLRNGPYMRRFLDGYFPLHLTVEIDYPAHLLSLQSVSPSTPDAPPYTREAGHIRWDAWFRGMLYTEITFSRIEQP